MKYIAGLLIIVLAILEFVKYNNYIKKKSYELQKLELILFEIPVVIIVFITLIGSLVKIEMELPEFLNYFLLYFFMFAIINPIILLAYYYLFRITKTKQYISIKIIGEYLSMTILNILIVYILPYPRNGWNSLLPLGLSMLHIIFTSSCIIYILVINAILFLFIKKSYRIEFLITFLLVLFLLNI